MTCTYARVTHLSIGLEANRTASGDGSGASLASGGRVELVAAELGALHVRDLIITV
jgi:hypothetical protein